MPAPSKVVKIGERPKPPAAGMGRRKGVPNKITREIKEMVTTALNNAGGVKYLTKQAKDNPTAFLSLVGKIIPLQVNAKHTVQHDTTILEERRAYAAEISQRLQ